LVHFQENRKNQKEMEKQAAIKSKMKDELELLKESVKSNKAVSNIKLPVYGLDERINVYRELERPPISLFIPLGHDVPNPDGSKIENPKKHYRRFFDDELENNKEIFTRPTFTNVEVIRVKQKDGTGGMFGNLFGGGDDDLMDTET